MIKAVIFDADGVLIEGRRFSRILERDYGITTATTDEFFRGPFEDCIIGAADLKEVLPPFLAKWGWKDGVEAFLSYWFRGEHTINQQLIEYIQSLRARGIICFLATNQEKYRFEYMLKSMGFENSFDRLYSSAHLGHKKPSLEYFEKVYEDLAGIEKDEIIFWDDTPANIESAREFGIEAELYTSFADFKERMADYV